MKYVWNTITVVLLLVLCCLGLKIYDTLNEPYIVTVTEKEFIQPSITDVVVQVQEKNELDKFMELDAQLNKIIDKSNPNLDSVKKEEYKKWIIHWCNEYDLPPLLIASMIHRETNYREHAISSVKARGPMQVMYKWHKDKCDKFNITEQQLHTIKYGIQIGCMVIKEYLNQTNGNFKQALYKYVGANKNKRTGEIYSTDILNMVAYAKR